MDSPEKISRAQNSLLWQLTKERHMDLDDLRAMTPANSVSSLTKDEASILINALIKRRSPDYSQSPRAAFARRNTPACPERRATRGVVRLPTAKLELADTACVQWLCRHWRRKDTGRPWTEKQFEDEFMGVRHYDHGRGERMSVIQTRNHLVQRRELFKMMIKKTKAAIARRVAAAPNRRESPAPPMRPQRSPRLADCRSLTADRSSQAMECQQHEAVPF